MSKQIDDKTKFTARLGRSGTSGVNWDRYFATIQMPWDSFLMVGKWNYDWEGEAGLYIDEDAWFSDQTLTGFYWRKNLAKGDITFFATHDDEYAEDKPFQELKDMYNYGARFNFNMNDKFRIAISGLYFDYDNDGTAKLTYSSSGAVRKLWDGDKTALKYYDYGTYWADFGITFSPGFEFKGAYYIQDHDGPNGVSHFDDSPNAYKAIIDVSQDVMKFTSLWIEYAKFDPN